MVLFEKEIGGGNQAQSESSEIKRQSSTVLLPVPIFDATQNQRQTCRRTAKKRSQMFVIPSPGQQDVEISDLKLVDQ